MKLKIYFPTFHFPQWNFLIFAFEISWLISLLEKGLPALMDNYCHAFNKELQCHCTISMGNIIQY